MGKPFAEWHCNLILLFCVLDTCSGWGILIYCGSSVVILSFSFLIPLLYSVTPRVLVILWEKVLSIGI